jgi:hypothetical protein
MGLLIINSLFIFLLFTQNALQKQAPHILLQDSNLCKPTGHNSTKMNKHSLFIITLLLLFSSICFSQNNNLRKQKFFLTAGYGLAGSFFVRSYDEFAPISSYKTFYKKHFIGVAQNASLGMNLKNNWDIRLGFHFQHFTRRVTSKDTLNNVIINLDHTIHHRDYIWYGSLNKKLEKRNHLYSFGLGLYYLRPKQEEVEIFYPGYFANVERDQKNSRLNEGGSFIEFAYEYKFQPKVNIGVKTQFYYTLSAGYAECVTLFPYIKILF